MTGEDWPGDETVTVDLVGPDGDIVTSVEVETDENGSFTTPVSVPEDAVPGDYTVEASDEQGNEANDALTVTVDDRTLTAQFTYPEREPGDEQEFSASGFRPGEAVRAVINSEPLNLPVRTADGDGEVTWTFVVPADFEGGSHTGTATSVPVGDSVVATFDVIVTAAPAPGDDTTSDGTVTTGGGGMLPRTGSDLWVELALAAFLIGAGAVTLGVVRRRDRSATE
ncbi:hypothetical protein GCM10023216_20710 [Isoptericola chiayiensis]|uniref:LPXTG-motif cell wall anchor domain protein n=1 Tax=Isoptericola chiayiensis TaxID=579446 RepID=A0ABP8YHK3_9MICO|nr:hypothetical protein [Isoptericola chiayiensis]